MLINLNLRRGMSVVFSAFLVLVLIVNTSDAAVVPYINERVSLLPGGGQVTSQLREIDSAPQISQDGRYVAFSSQSSQFVTGDTNGRHDIYVRDRVTGGVVRANVSDSGVQMTGDHTGFALSKNGRYVAFIAAEAGLVPGDTNLVRDVFVRDLKLNTTERVSISTAGSQQNNYAYSVDISADGRYVVFESAASNLIANDTNNKLDVYVRDTKLDTTSLLSKNVSGSVGNDESRAPSISCDGSYVVFWSFATDLTTGDTNGKGDVFVADRINGGALKNITASSNGHSTSSMDIACNGSKVLFTTGATNIVPNDTNGAIDIFAYDMEDESTQRVTLDSSENELTGYNVWPLTKGDIDFSGRYVVFSHRAANVVSNDTNDSEDIFIRDLEEGTTQIINKRDAATGTIDQTLWPSITLDGREVVYVAKDSGLVTGDTNGFRDVFVSKTGL